MAQHHRWAVKNVVAATNRQGEDQIAAQMAALWNRKYSIGLSKNKSKETMERLSKEEKSQTTARLIGEGKKQLISELRFDPTLRQTFSTHLVRYLKKEFKLSVHKHELRTHRSYQPAKV
jgi:hypothetical protein